MAFDWDDYGTGAFQTWENVGDSIRGKVLAVRQGRDFNGGPCPELVMDVAGEDDNVIVTAGQAMLQSKLAQVRPAKGWEIEIRFSGYGEAKRGQNPPKQFTVEVLSRGDGTATGSGAATGSDL